MFAIDSSLTKKCNRDCKSSESNKRCAGCEVGLTRIPYKMQPQIESNEYIDDCMQTLKTQFQSTIHVFEGNLVLLSI